MLDQAASRLESLHQRPSDSGPVASSDGPCISLGQPFPSLDGRGQLLIRLVYIELDLPSLAPALPTRPNGFIVNSSALLGASTPLPSPVQQAIWPLFSGPPQWNTGQQ